MQKKKRVIRWTLTGKGEKLLANIFFVFFGKALIVDLSIPPLGGLPVSLERRKKNGGKYGAGNIGKWMIIGSELPIMVVTGVFIGNYIGQQFSSQFSSYWPVISTYVSQQLSPELSTYWLIIGNYIGQQFSSQFSVYWAIIGAILGFLVGIYNLFKIIRLWESRDISKRIDKKETHVPSPPPIESKVLLGEVQQKDSKLSEDEKWERVLKLMKLQVNFEDEENSSDKNDTEFEE
jgi:hypothetical protein